MDKIQSQYFGIRSWRWLIGPAVLVFIWWLITAVGLVKPIFLPPPAHVVNALWHMMTISGRGIRSDVVATLSRVLVGLAVGIGIGLPIGLFLGYFSWLHDIWELPLDFFRSTPVTALFPFFLLIFGIGDTGKIAIASWAVALIIVINTIYGVRSCSSVRSRYLKSIGANSYQTIVWQLIPEALPHIIGGVRIAISQAFIVVVVTEMFYGSDKGLGYQLYSAALMYRSDEVIALILISGILGYIINKIAEKAGKKIVFWL
ncbi:MAG: ABC transporter permease [Desulfovibrionales bacterium]|nr:ABC transporter permease [Desulfovibrionales bacterium]